LAGGAGMSEVFDESMLEALVTQGKSSTTDEEADGAPIKLDTIIMADPGTTIRGEDIYNLIQAARVEGVTAASKMRELKNVSVQTTVSPGPGVVRQLRVRDVNSVAIRRPSRATARGESSESAKRKIGMTHSRLNGGSLTIAFRILLPESEACPKDCRLFFDRRVVDAGKLVLRETKKPGESPRAQRFFV
jgi:hypothetical protein